MRLAALLVLCACGSSTAARPTEATLDNDPHRHLTAAECGRLYDYMHGHGWMTEVEAPRQDVVKGCVDAPGATRAFLDCVLASSSREESDRCQ